MVKALSMLLCIGILLLSGTSMMESDSAASAVAGLVYVVLGLAYLAAALTLVVLAS